MKTKQSVRKSFVPIVTFVLFIFLLGAMIFFGLRNARPASDAVGATQDAVVQIEPEMLDMGTVRQSEGIAERSFTIENKGAAPLRISSLQTSCMCTSVQLVVGEEKSQRFGMAGHGGSSAAPRSWSMEIPPGTQGELKVFYDPNAHGPSGVGPVERIITFNTNDIAHQNVEVRIRGIVTP